jgi:ferritin-like metal-binding protein YciE
MEVAKQIADLLVEEIKDLYSAEKQLMKALPEMAAAAGHPGLSQALATHLQATSHQTSRLEKAAELLNAKAGGKRCKGMEGLLEEGSEAIDEHGNSECGDLALIGAALRIEHYEIAGYQSALEMARHIGADEVAQLLTESFEEEKAAEKELRNQALEFLRANPNGAHGHNETNVPKMTEYPAR